MGTTHRFSDGQYKNWLRCSHSLIIMKEALHDYIYNEVKKLQGDIALKVCSIPCGSSTGNQCGSCTWKNIKLTGGNPRTWSINCKNSICDKWLHQILAVHDDPHNPSINWKNADISMWPTDCYQVAKIFMPKGQDKTTKMPEDLDAPAILSLMKYCNWFRKDLPNTQILSDLIDIRNKVLHSGDLRIADSDKDSWIDLMIQLLTDLNIQGDAQAELQELKGEDIDINFRETEIRVLQNLVSRLGNELTTVKEDMDCVQKLQTQLSEEVKHLKDNTTENNVNVDTLEGMRKSLDELKSISDKMVSFFDKNPDIYDIKITESMRDIATDVQGQQENLSKVEAEILNIKARLSKLEEEHKKLWTNQEENNKELTGLRKRFEEQKENDEQLSLQKDAARKRRKETDALKQLKNQTEDKLDTLRKLECIPTKQAEEAKKLLEVKSSIVIKGNPGEGKTTMALHLIYNEIYRDKREVLNYPKEWKKVDTDCVGIVVIEDIFGQFDLDPARLHDWMIHLPILQEHVDAGKLRVIVTTRVDILSKAYSKLGSLKLFSDDLSLTLSSKQLTKSEKLNILNRELHRHKRNMQEDEKEKCIDDFIGLIGFPQCCQLFAGDNKSFDRGPDFFRSPEKFFVGNITELESTRFLCLAFLFCNGKIWEEHLSSETMPETSKNVLIELAASLNISEKKASITLLRNAYDDFLELYVVKSESYNFNWMLEVDKLYIYFTHATVIEAVGQVLGERCTEMVVKYGKSEYLYQRTYTADSRDFNSQKVFIPVSLYGLLARRMLDDVVKRRVVENVAKHSALRQHSFVMKLKCETMQDNLEKSFFMPVPEHRSSDFDCDGYDDYDDDYDLSERNCRKSDSSKGECNSFMQYILKNDEDVVTLVYSQFLEFLACTHDKNSPDCWQCEEKQTLLELALYYQHFQIADELINIKACYTHVCLSNITIYGDLERVQTIVETLKRSQVFNPGCKEAKDALCRAYISGNQSLTEFLLKDGITLDSCHVTDVVKGGDMNILMKVVEHLKCHMKWKPHWEKHSMQFDYVHSNCHFSDVEKNENPCSTALFLACVLEKFDMADYLLKNEVKGSMQIFISMSKWSSVKGVARMIQTLKDNNNWDPKCDESSEALEGAYMHKKDDVCNFLAQEGVSLTMKNLPGIVCRVSFEYIKRAIQNMKDTNNWDPKCDDASEALSRAHTYERYDVCDLLAQEGFSLTMKNLPYIVYNTYSVSFENIKRAIQIMKETKSWDPKCDDASNAFKNAYYYQKYDACDLLIREGVVITVKILADAIYNVSFQCVKKAIQNMKDTNNWDPRCDDASEALKTAYIHQKYDVCDLLIHEGVSLTMKSLPNMVFWVPLETIKKEVQNMKDNDNWDPKCDDASGALKHAYILCKYDVFDLLVQEGVLLTMENLAYNIYIVSLEGIKKAIQNMKDNGTWDPKSNGASNALENAYRNHKYDVCDLLEQEGVSLTMNNLPNVVCHISFEYITKAIQDMKVTDNWDPKCHDASKALKNAYCGDMYGNRKHDVCDLLVQEGVSLTMKNLLNVVYGESSEFVRKVIQNMKCTDSWDPKCNDAAKALENAFLNEAYDVCDLLVQEGVSLIMKSLSVMVDDYWATFEKIEKSIQNIKSTGNWDPRCDDATKALEKAYRNADINEDYEVCNLLVQEGVSLTMETLSNMINILSFESVKKAIQNMKGTSSWDPKCDDASNALQKAHRDDKYDVCDLLVEEGVQLTMQVLSLIETSASIEHIKKAIQNLKDTDNWDPMDNDASEALADAYRWHKYDVCDLLIQEGISPASKNLLCVSNGYGVKKVIQDLKDNEKWNPNSYYASKTLEMAYRHKSYDVCDLLIQEGVSLKMQNLPDIGCSVSFEHFKREIENMKNTGNWDPKCDVAAKALKKAYRYKKYNVFDLLSDEGVSLTMKNLPDVIYSVSFERIKVAIKNMKETKNWDPTCDAASEGLATAYMHQKYDVCDLLIHEGVSLTMKYLTDMVSDVPLEAIKKEVQNMKDTDNWDPKCEDASVALENAYRHQKYDVCDLLVREEVSLTMKNLCNMASKVSYQVIKKAIQTMKDTDKWDPKCEDASKALEYAYVLKAYDVCELFIQEGALLSMKNLPLLVFSGSLESVRKAIQHLQYSDNWDPNCDDASGALENAYKYHTNDMCDLLIQEGVSLTMKNLPALTGTFHLSFETDESYDDDDDDDDNFNMVSSVRSVSFENIKKGIQNLKDTDSWDPKCDDASKAFENAYARVAYDVCNLLVQEGVVLTMDNLSSVVLSASFENINKAIQNMKVTANWDPKCDNASKALEYAYRYQKYDLCGLLVQEGVSLTMKNLPEIVMNVSLEKINEAIKSMKDTNSWDPKCDDASKALANAFFVHMYRNQKHDVSDLLVQEGVSLKMKNLTAITGTLCVFFETAVTGVLLSVSLENIRKAIQIMKSTGNWDPKDNDASSALNNAYRHKRSDVCDLLIQEGVSLTMKNLPDIVLNASCKIIMKAIRSMKDNKSWNPRCDDAFKALEYAYEKHHVCDLLVQEGVSLTMKNLPHVVKRVSFENIRKAIKNMKDTAMWDPKCDDAFEALRTAYSYQRYNVSDLLIQEGASLTIKTLSSVVDCVPLKSVKNLMRHLKDTESWDPRHADAPKALKNAYRYLRYDVCDLLVQEGVSLTMKKLPSVVYGLPFGTFLKLVQHLKDTKNWDPKCDYASEALKNANSYQRYDVCDLIVQEGVLHTKQ